jgi:sodium-dependent phosphate cotransporter
MEDPPFADSGAPASSSPSVSPTLRATGRAGLARAALTPTRLRKVGLFLLSLALFILALTLMKEGASGFSSLVRDRFGITGILDSLGFGWLCAYLLMSGSPVAATALTFFNSGILSQMSTYAMITGSRLGASFIVLSIGFIYVLRGRDRATSLGMGLLSLAVTGSTHLLGMVIGLKALQAGLPDSLSLHSGVAFGPTIDLTLDPIVGSLLRSLPHWSLFLVGLAIMLGSFNLFDRCLPQMAIKSSHVGGVSQLVYRRWVMFLLGAAVTLISMSVSVSLGILVPLSNRGFVRRENVVPYIMGANITTFIDTLLASVLLGNPAALTIVLIQMTTITLVSVVILATAYRPYERSMLRFTGWVTARNRNLIVFMISIFVIPIVLMLL